VAKLSALIEREGVKAIFPESSINKKLATPSPARPGPRRGTRSTATPWDRRVPAARPIWAWSAQTPTRWSAASPEAGKGADSGLVSVRSPLVSAEGLAAGYGTGIVLRDVSFAARAGERVAVLGPNGGGKTTLFRVLTGS
jgi:ABC-type multidrug transport system fused ATPase/permease subunit